MCLSLCLLSAVLLGVLYLFFGVSPASPETNSLEEVPTDIPIGFPTGLRKQPRLQLVADWTHILRAIRRKRNRRLMRSLLATKLQVTSKEHYAVEIRARD
jgi:hypothetical protein